MTSRSLSNQSNLNVNHQHHAFTLLELILVMAVLVVVAALSVPAIQQTFARQTLTQGADRVRVAMGQARVRSIKNGEIYALFFAEGGSWFNVAPFAQADAQAALASPRETIATQRQQDDLADDLLPRGIRFAADQIPVDARAAESLASENNTTLQPILFYPDGTSQDASIVLQNELDQFLEIQLRGLTGLSTVIRLSEEPNR